MRKLTLALIASAAIGALAIAGIASAAKPKPLGFYCAKYDCFQVDQTGKSMSSFQGRCTAEKHPKFFFEVFGMPIDGKGKFSYDQKNAVNTPDGGTLSKEYRVTIAGRFVSKSEAKGTYQLHKKGCKKVSFDGKLQKN
jgi:hypothetical protein